jgi:hypothetical protein
MFVIGETFQTDFGAFDYVIQKAYDRGELYSGSLLLETLMGDSLSSFPYMNYDLSTCDVLSITLAMVFNSSQGSAYSTADVC